MPLYDTIVKQLRIPSEFFVRYLPVMREKFREASRREPKLDGIKQCLHVASSVVLRQEPIDLDNALKVAAAAIQREPDLSGKDPETLLTVATAYFLLARLARERHSPDVGKQEELDLRHVQQMLDEKNWMIGQPAMQKLGIERSR